MATRSHVLGDIALLRQSLCDAGNPHLPLLRLEVWRPLRDLAFDLAVIGGVLALALAEPWAIPLALLVVGQRQRALGNLMHDAAHRNLTRRRRLNDLLARMLIAPLLFLSLSRYRDLHFRHHLQLGCAVGDPDLIPIPAHKARSWQRALLANALSPAALAGSAFGHLADQGMRRRSRLYIVGWWAVATGLLAWAATPSAAVQVLALWLAARVSVFHLITTFREMCDHHGLEPGGVFSFTRDLQAPGPWAWLIHPRHNGYHLTHHLLPAIPYYRLPQAQSLFAGLPPYRQRGQVCRSYFGGPQPVVDAWQQEPGS